VLAKVVILVMSGRIRLEIVCTLIEYISAGHLSQQGVPPHVLGTTTVCMSDVGVLDFSRLLARLNLSGPGSGNLVGKAQVTLFCLTQLAD